LGRTLVYFAGLAALVTAAAPASAQTAYELNRLNQAIQVCNSPMGAGLAECAKLRGQLGMGASTAGGMGGGGLGLGGGKGAAAAGLLGALNAAMATRPAPPPVATPSADPQRIAGCVRAAGSDTACLVPATTAPVASPATPSLGPATRSAGAEGEDTARAIHQAGQSYQACAAANPTNWRSCLPLLSGGASR
jgi:hypothetical protein